MHADPIYKKNKLKLKTILKNEVCLKGMNCHHLIPQHMGGSHEVENLCYMRIEDHDKLHDVVGERPNLTAKELKEIARKFGAIGVDYV